MEDWINRAAALSVLGVKPQTLYAYVSRGQIAVQREGRSSLYRAADVAMLAARKARGRKPRSIATSSLSWGEPSIETALSTVVRGRLIYAGQDAVALSRTHTLEAVAALLWNAAAPVSFAVPAGPAHAPFPALATAVGGARPLYGRGLPKQVQDAQAAIGLLAAATGVRAGSAALHLGLAGRWGLDAKAAEIIRTALVLMADHDLNASTFACRVAASTGASMPAALLAGLCALSGPAHGGASAALARLVDEAAQGQASATVQRWLDAYGQLPGFGHPLYPEGDVRARALLDQVQPDSRMIELAETVYAETGLHPNIDFALTVATRTLGLPEDAPFTLFLLGRSVGWAAHAIEQAQSRHLIRPRGIYTGPVVRGQLILEWAGFGGYRRDTVG